MISVVSLQRHSAPHIYWCIVKYACINDTVATNGIVLSSVCVGGGGGGDPVRENSLQALALSKWQCTHYHNNNIQYYINTCQLSLHLQLHLQSYSQHLKKFKLNSNFLFLLVLLFRKTAECYCFSLHLLMDPSVSSNCNVSYWSWKESTWNKAKTLKQKTASLKLKL